MAKKYKVVKYVVPNKLIRKTSGTYQNKATAQRVAAKLNKSAPEVKTARYVVQPAAKKRTVRRRGIFGI